MGAVADDDAAGAADAVGATANIATHVIIAVATALNFLDSDVMDASFLTRLSDLLSPNLTE